MFGKPAEKPKEAPKVDPMGAITVLNDQLTQLEKRHKVQEMKMEEALQSALKANKAGDKRNAMRFMQTKKALEKDLAKIEGQQVVLEQMKLNIEGAVNDSGVVQGMKTAKDAI